MQYYKLTILIYAWVFIFPMNGCQNKKLSLVDTNNSKKNESDPVARDLFEAGDPNKPGQGGKGNMGEAQGDNGEAAAQPSNISGIYLTCAAPSNQTSTTEKFLGCRYQYANGAKIAKEKYVKDWLWSLAGLKNVTVQERPQSVWEHVLFTIPTALNTLEAIRAANYQVVMTGLDNKTYQDIKPIKDITIGLNNLNGPTTAPPITNPDNGTAKGSNAECGAVRGVIIKRCYDSTFIANSKGEATLVLDDNRTAIQYTTNTNGVKMWREKNGSRIVRGNGLGWSPKLTADGKMPTATPFTDYNSITGRVCPKKIYLSDSLYAQPNHCLFYRSATASSLNTAAFTSTNPAWFQGNIASCSDLGMRLPTIYEAAVNPIDVNLLPTTDKMIFDATTGIPAAAGEGATWTATKCKSGDNHYFSYRQGTASCEPATSQKSVICVVP